MLAAYFLFLFIGVTCTIATKNQVKGDYNVDGSMVLGRVECVGYLCPQWKLMITRYDVQQELKTPNMYDLQELLPLAPTAQRSFNVLTAYDVSSRQFSIAFCDYPQKGIDTYFTATVSNGIDGTTPILSNVMVPHPDASIGNTGKISMVKIVSVNQNYLVATFNDGNIYQVDIKNQKYIKLGSLFNGAYFLTTAHVLDTDASTLHVFVTDLQEDESYLINVDLSTSGIAIASDPIQIGHIQGELGKSIPLNAFMYSGVGSNNTTQLLLMQYGNFDTISFIDTTSGAITPLISNMAGGSGMNGVAEIYCNTATKDCDLWSTASIDPITQDLYFQAHDMSEGDDDPVASIYKFGFLENRITKIYYPNCFATETFVQFGFYGYNFVNFIN
jgi:hypothetical protein